MILGDAMTIAIVGTGRIGAGLGRAWAAAGHRVTFATRNPDDPKVSVLARSIGAEASSIAAALSGADVVVLAVPFGAVPSVAKALPSWEGRVVIDCTNPIGPGLTLQHGLTDSGAEVNARLLTGARVVKSFNAQGAENLAQATYGGVAATNFYCGDDAAAKTVVRQLIADVGFEPIDLGGLSAARYLEPMTFVWLAAAKALGSRAIAFKILRA